jgi:hypothetical protein
LTRSFAAAHDHAPTPIASTIDHRLHHRFGKIVIA